MDEIRLSTAPGLDYQTKIQYIEKQIDRGLKVFGQQGNMFRDAVMKAAHTHKNILPCSEATVAGEDAKQPEGPEGEDKGEFSRKSSQGGPRQSQGHSVVEPSSAVPNNTGRQKSDRHSQSLSESNNSLEDDLELDRLRKAIEESKNTLEVQQATLEQERVKYKKLLQFQIESQHDFEKLKQEEGRHGGSIE